MTGHTAHDAFLKVGHKLYVLYEFIFALVKGGEKNIGNIYTPRTRVKDSTPNISANSSGE